jgi:hypothetical protein
MELIEWARREDNVLPWPVQSKVAALR